MKKADNMHSAKLRDYQDAKKKYKNTINKIKNFS